jgi:2-hydroxycyclohexanecarboxyl-CoA dehydrogenase
LEQLPAGCESFWRTRCLDEVVDAFPIPDDDAAVVEFLASGDARFITGQTIPVDGDTLAASGWYARADHKGWTNMPNEA